MRYIHRALNIFTSLLLFSCTSWFLPPLEIVSYQTDGNKITVWFSHEVDRNSLIDAFSFSEDGNNVKGSFQFEKEVVTFIPCTQITHGHNYALTILNTAESIKGCSLIETFTHTFSTKTENTPPTIISTNPRNQEEVTTAINQITLNFSESVHEESFYKSFSISPAQAHRVVWNKNFDSAKILFDTSLPLSKRYTVTLSTALCDLENNYLTKPYTFAFLNGSDFTAPEYTLHYKNESIEKELEQDNIPNENIPTDSTLILNFNEECSLDGIQSFIKIYPDISYTVEIDKKSKIFAQIIFKEKPTWNQEYTVTIKEGISDIAGNKTNESKAYLLHFNNEDNKPPTFFQGFFKITDSNYLEINKYTDYSTVTLPVDIFSTIDEHETEYYVLFKISKTAQSLNYISVLENIRITSGNSCASFLITNIELLSKNDIEISEIGKMQIVQEELLKGFNVVGAKCNVTVENTGSRGLIRFLIGKGLQDTNDNNLEDDLQFTYNKQ